MFKAVKVEELQPAELAPDNGGPLPGGRLPDFFIIGAGKCGTTTLYQYLERHPRIFACTPKEPEFFSDPEHYSRGFAGYQRLFEQARTDQLCCDASTTYTRWPHTLDCAQLIHRVRPDAKLIYIMREPVARLYSNYRFRMREGVTATFEDWLKGHPEFIDLGMYKMQIDRYLRFFPRERMLFLFNRDLKQRCTETLDRVQEFLGLQPVDLIASREISANVSGDEDFIRKHTTGRLRAIPGVNQLATLMPRPVKDRLFRTLRGSTLGKKLSQKHQIPPLNNATKEYLIQLYAKPNQELEQLLGIELPHWRQVRV